MTKFRKSLIAAAASVVVGVSVFAGIAGGTTSTVNMRPGNTDHMVCANPISVANQTEKTVDVTCAANGATTTTTTVPPTTTTTTVPPTTTTTVPPTTTTTTQPPTWSCVSTATSSTGHNAYCPSTGNYWPADPVNFVGTTGGSDVNGNNFWSQSGWTTTINANSAQNFQVVASYPANPNGVNAYPSVEAVNYSGTVDNLTKLTSTFNESFPHNSLVYAHAMQDDWFYGPGTSNTWADEMMVQTDFSNDFPNNNCVTSGNGNWDIIAAGVTFPSVDGSSATQQWYLCDGSDPRFQTDGSACPYATGTGGGWHCVMEWKPGQVTQTSPGNWQVTQAPDNYVGTVNLQAMVQYLETHTQPTGQPDFPTGARVGHLSAGWEILGTGGNTSPYNAAPVTFTGSGYQIDCVGCS